MRLLPGCARRRGRSPSESARPILPLRPSPGRPSRLRRKRRALSGGGRGGAGWSMARGWAMVGLLQAVL